MTTTILLARHGHVVDNDLGADAHLCGRLDATLSPLGREQVRRLRDRLAAEPAVHAIYASPLPRALQTAETIAGVVGERLRLYRGLQEISCGELEGWRIADVQRCYPQLWQRNAAQSDETFLWPGGESYRAFRRRCLRSIQRISGAHHGERVLIVTHAGVISQLLGALHGISAARWGEFRAGNASLSEVEWEDAGGRLLRFDDRSHLLA